MSLVKMLAAYTFAAMATGVIAAILLVNKNLDMGPVTAVITLVLAIPVLALAVLALSNRQQGY